MNLVTLNQTQNNTNTMTSREIALVTDKTHRHVLADIEKLNESYIEMALPKIGQSEYQADNGQSYRQFILTKEQTLDLMTGYSRELRIKVNRRWAELEEQVSKTPTLPTTYLEALKALVTSEEEKAVIQHQLEAAAPKVHHYDTIVDRYNLMTATQVGQKLGITAFRLNKHLEDLNVYNRSVKRGRTFKQWFIDEGYGVMKEANKGYSQPLITGKGQAWIVEQLTFNKVVPEAITNKIEYRRLHTEAVIAEIDSLLVS